MKLETLRHSTSHVMAYAVKELFPSVKLAIGPAIEEGFYYDFDFERAFTPEDLVRIEQKMHEIIKKDYPFKKINVSKQKAKEMLKGEPYKLELLGELKEEPTFYQCGDFIDLCKGPHINSTKEIAAFKLTKIAGAYWRGSAENKQLQRIYGIAFETKDDLKKYITFLEEAEKRDHVKLGRQLDLFSTHEEGPGFPFWHHNGVILKNELIKYWREEHTKEGYIEIQTPMILSRELWEQSGHWDLYKENMYTTKIDNRDFAIKPMNCPGGIILYKMDVHSYKELPLRIAELGYVHRHELSGVLNGLLRVRAFTQDDAHIFCTEEQLEDEIIRIVSLIKRMLATLGFTDYEYTLSIRSAEKKSKYLGTDKGWKTAEDAIKKALKKLGAEFTIEEGEAKFYGPSLDVRIRDALGRKWQCSTIQLDFNLPNLFNITYEGKDGKKHVPFMLHRVVYGSLERFIAVMIEHYTGKFPLWLNPVQVKILSVADRFNDYAEEIKKTYRDAGIRAETDIRTESISKKVREAQLAKINYIIVVGEKEVNDSSVTVRSRNNQILGTFKIEEFLEQLLKEIKEKR